MKIVIGNANINNIDNLNWCLGEAGLAQMSSSVDMTTHQVNVDVKDLISVELGDMILELYKYDFTVIICK